MTNNKTVAGGDLDEVGDGLFAYLQADAWGLSNAGLIVDGEATMLVDTLFDKRHTQRMLDTMRAAVPAARRIETVVNTHANGDHCWGNELVRDARILASAACAEEMKALPPKKTALLLKAASVAIALGPAARGVAKILDACSISMPADLVEAAPFVREIFARFEFGDIELVLPSETFEGQKRVLVGDREVELIEVGPAHTRGDTLVVVPDARVVFTGDILFMNSHPIVWEGPYSNWIAACERILALDVERVVPGHGPLTDKEGVRRTVEYLRFVHTEAKARYEAGMSVEEAARDISMAEFSQWSERERVVVNVRTAYREFAGEEREADDVVEMFAAMARFRAGRAAR